MLKFLTRLIVPAYERRRSPSKLVAIIVPVTSRPELTPDEAISVRHLQHYFKNHDKYLIVPPGSDLRIEGCEVKTFGKKFFGSVTAHNRLLFSRGFYREFEDYNYVLIYHLDALVLSDQLEQWCMQDLDYIGAPWLRSDDGPWPSEDCVGNGGFTLMKVESALRVLHNRHRTRPRLYWQDRWAPLFEKLVKLSDSVAASRLGFLDAMMKRILGRHWGKVSEPQVHVQMNDVFWSFEARKYLPGFKVGSVEQGLRFAFEREPRRCFERAHHRMPFGCHGWPLYDRDFWEPHLLETEAAVRGGVTAELVR